MLRSRRKISNKTPSKNGNKDGINTLINSITDAIFKIDGQGTVQAYNAAALNLLDTNDVITGAHISDLIDLETSDGGSFNIFKELRKNTTIRQRDDIIMHLPEGDKLCLEVTLAPVQGESHSGAADEYVVVVKDITREKSLAEEQDEFISVVSHELRTPVTIAEGSLSNAEILVDRGMTEKAKDAVVEARKQVIFLSKMVNDLSTLSRAEKGITDSPEDINVTELAHQLHSEYTEEASKKRLQLNLNISGKPKGVHVSRLYLQELLQNFITNAIKYTPSGSVTISIRQVNQLIEFSVTDTGIGIGKADRQKIFNRFYRAEDYRTRETSGTGLGLYVASKLARKLGGSIEVESRLNHGSTFRISLPVKE